MEIVDSSPTDLTVEDAARIAGRSVKTVRRAVHAGQLPMRYVLGLRGPQLVFQPFEIARWQAGRSSTGDARAKTVSRPRPTQPRTRSGRVPGVEALLATVEKMGATVAALSKRLADQECKLDSAHSLLSELAHRIEDRAESR
jgi:Helix-turn-helix domain